jgi:hypothetical protein
MLSYQKKLNKVFGLRKKGSSDLLCEKVVLMHTEVMLIKNSPSLHETKTI